MNTVDLRVRRYGYLSLQSRRSTFDPPPPNSRSNFFRFIVALFHFAAWTVDSLILFFLLNKRVCFSIRDVQTSASRLFLSVLLDSWSRRRTVPSISTFLHYYAFIFKSKVLSVCKCFKLF